MLMKTSVWMKCAGTALGLSALALTGCQQDTKGMDELHTQVKALQEKVDQQEQLVVRLANNYIRLQGVASKFEYTEFDPQHVRYFILNNGIVSLLGQVVSVQPQEKGGAAVTLRFANSNSVAVANPGFAITWGPSLPQGDKVSPEQAKAWQDNLHSTAFDGQLVLRPGEWSEVTFNLPDVPADKLGYMRLALTMDHIQFAGPAPARTAAPANATAPAHGK